MLVLTLLLAAFAEQGSQRPLARPETAVAVADAATFAGKTKIVCGRVATAVSPATRNDRTTLNLTDGASAALAVIITAPDRSRFTPMFERLLVGREVCAEGKIEQTGSGIELRARETDQFKYIGPPVRSPDFAPGVVRATPVRMQARSGIGSRLPPTDVTDPVPTSQPGPKYTSAAMKAKIQGDVEMEVVIGTTGSVESLQLTRSLDPLLGLDEEAMRTVFKWMFRPAMRAGQPIQFVAVVVLTFRLH